MDKTFREYGIDQAFLLPPDLRDWLPEGHLALFLADVVEELDLSALYRDYGGDGRGQPPYDPRMMLTVLLYAYCIGKPSSRAIERATHEDVAFRVLAANQHPDHDTICEFRRRHLKALAGLFLQVLQLCAAAGLVKLGHVALDGTKVKANASKHKAMSYRRMLEREQELRREIEGLLREAEATDRREDALHGPGRRGDELPHELARRTTRLKKIQEAREALEAQAREEAERRAAEAQAKAKEGDRDGQPRGRGKGGRGPRVPDVAEARPHDKAQRNFTDPDSRIMRDGATKSFEQAYNAQAAVDDQAQIIVAADVTRQANDKQQLVPMLEQVAANLGRKPEQASADAGFFSEAAVTDPRLEGIELFVPPDKQRHGEHAAPADESDVPCAAGEVSVADRMRHKLRTPAGRDVYKKRKAVVEPVFGQIKEARGFRRFLLRGKANVTAEWAVICMTHNLRKLHLAGWAGAAT